MQGANTSLDLGLIKRGPGLRLFSIVEMQRALCPGPWCPETQPLLDGTVARSKQSSEQSGCKSSHQHSLSLGVIFKNNFGDVGLTAPASRGRLKPQHRLLLSSVG